MDNWSAIRSRSAVTAPLAGGLERPRASSSPRRALGRASCGRSGVMARDERSRAPHGTGSAWCSHAFGPLRH
ncbi:hypothetical protein ACFPM0_25440 [Pseudonocardia sulfidoxydans]|uniref:hypothetical protein n=1 Tax=Pseudonocardia sulfidoxydans TaxID=54011 RepID=UPI0036100C21